MPKKDLIYKYCLQNAIFYNGKADAKSVMGKIMSAEPELRKNASEVKKEIEKQVKEVNKLSLEKQRLELEKIDPKLMIREEKKQEELPSLQGAVKGKVVTRFAPSPTGPLNIAQVLRAAMLNYLIAKKYNGKFLLRIEDTDPRKVERKFIGWIKEDLTKLGIKWDKLIQQSKRLDVYYKKMEELLRKNKAYVCSCSSEQFKKHIREKKDCPHRSEKSDLWNKMKSGKCKEGECVVRFKTSMKDPNPALRDPVLFRIIGKKPWPLYNFANVVDDHDFNVTHVFRGKEHEHNTEIQKRLCNAFDWKIPVVINFGMIYLSGEKLHTRDIKEGIKSGKYSGWDDPKLHTIRALLRRGIQVETIKRLALSVGFTKTDIRISDENIEGMNRKVVDPISKKVMVVIDSVKITVNGKSVFISKEDWNKFKGKNIRLIELGNVRLDKRSEFLKDQSVHNYQKVQWVGEKNVKLKIVMMDKTISAVGEERVSKLKIGDIVQMMRIGFGKIDSKNIIYFAHR